jgi:hypothetical protein
MSWRVVAGTRAHRAGGINGFKYGNGNDVQPALIRTTTAPATVC